MDLSEANGEWEKSHVKIIIRSKHCAWHVEVVRQPYLSQQNRESTNSIRFDTNSILAISCIENTSIRLKIIDFMFLEELKKCKKYNFGFFDKMRTAFIRSGIRRGHIYVIIQS